MGSAMPMPGICVLIGATKSIAITSHRTVLGTGGNWTCPNWPLFVALFFALLAAGVPVIYTLRYPLLGWASSSRTLVPFHDVSNDPAGLAHWFWQVFVALQASNDALSAASSPKPRASSRASQAPTTTHPFLATTRPLLWVR